MPKRLITKRVSDLTPEDKAQYLAYLKESFAVNYGDDWDELEPKIQAEIDQIFDDKAFADLGRRKFISFRLSALFPRLFSLERKARETQHS